MADDVPLAVDLDGTLILTDTLLEAWWATLSSNPCSAGRALAALAQGRAGFKRALAGRTRLEADALPYNEAVLSLVHERRQDGGAVALVTASDRRWAEAVAEHLGCFDEVHASDGVTNLKGPEKAAFLRDRFGARGFDYAGDAEADLPVWREARRAITVGASGRLRAEAEAAAPEAVHLDAAPDAAAVSRLPPWLKAMRPHQWLKNLLIFLPAVASHNTDPGVWLASLVAFVTFSMTASGVYLLNDLLDLSADRIHPRKRLRPLAAGTLPLLHGSLMAPAVLGGALLLALLLASPGFVLVLLGYLVLTTAYSLFLKRMLVIDICVLAGLYTVRVFAGAVASGIAISPWLLAFSIFLFLSLAAVKRQAELVSDLRAGKPGAAGRAYRTDDLPVILGMALASGYLSVLVMALYMNTPAVLELYNSPSWLWGVCAVLLFWISRAIMIAHRGEMDDDPVVFAIKDSVSRACLGVIVCIVLGGAFL